MKYVYYAVALLVGIIGGYSKGIIHKSILRISLTVILLMAGIITSLYPPIVGSFQDAVTENKVSYTPIAVFIPKGGIRMIGDSVAICRDMRGREAICIFSEHTNAVMAKSKQQNILITTNPISHSTYKVITINPAPTFMLPYIPGLGERARIMFFHVPSAWTGFFAYFLTMIFSIRYLRKGRLLDDTIAYSSAIIGTVFTAIAYVTGAIWAKFNWGHFFNWDTRELSVLLLLAVYAAYFVLRFNVKGEGMRRLSAVYAIIATVAAVFLIFILPRITISLHPGSKDDTSIGPLLSPEQTALDMTKAAVFSLMFAGFILLYSWLLNITVRYQLLCQRLSQ